MGRSDRNPRNQDNLDTQKQQAKPTGNKHKYEQHLCASAILRMCAISPTKPTTCSPPAPRARHTLRGGSGASGGRVSSSAGPRGAAPSFQAAMAAGRAWKRHVEPRSKQNWFKNNPNGLVKK